MNMNGIKDPTLNEAKYVAFKRNYPHLAEDFYDIVNIIDTLSQEVVQQRIERIKRLKLEYDLGIIPSGKTIAEAMAPYLRKPLDDGGC